MSRSVSAIVATVTALIVAVGLTVGLVAAGCRGPQRNPDLEVQADHQSPAAVEPVTEASSENRADTEEHESNEEPQEEIGADLFIPLTKDTYEDLVVNAGKPVVIVFGSRTCGICRKLKERIVEVADEYRDDISFLLVDGNREEELTGEFKATKSPTVCILSRGRELGRWQGLKTEDELRERFDRLVGKRRETEGGT